MNLQYPCIEGAEYYGRGTIPVFLNYNYGAAVGRIHEDLLNHPEAGVPGAEHDDGVHGDDVEMDDADEEEAVVGARRVRLLTRPSHYDCPLPSGLILDEFGAIWHGCIDALESLEESMNEKKADTWMGKTEWRRRWEVSAGNGRKAGPVDSAGGRCSDDKEAGTAVAGRPVTAVCASWHARFAFRRRLAGGGALELCLRIGRWWAIGLKSCSV
uniref:chitinase n=1 Tax=Oryza punctata TaxID=4537 RepID=A0A0E0KT90_ORYPU